MILVLTTVSNVDEAEDLAEKMVGTKLAACVQILPQMKSVYYWDGAIQKEPEHLLIIKTLESKFDELSQFIRENHSYDVPEIVAFSAEKVSASYLIWMKDYLG